MMVTEAETRMLKMTFYHRVVKGRNIYENSTPEEWKKFELFVREFGPFDLVIDGLNVAYKADDKDPEQRTIPSASRVCKGELTGKRVFHFFSALLSLTKTYGSINFVNFEIYISVGRCR